MSTNERSRFWISWEERSPDHRPLTDPPNVAILGWWCSGYGDGYATLCALVEARSERAAKAAVDQDWPAVGRRVWRFVEERDADWLPGDRFPMSGWMRTRAEVPRAR